jgi:hypothetical protein
VKRAARAKYVEAQFSLGVCLSRGEGVSANPREAFKWYLRAAKQGHDDAAYNVGLFYEKGSGVQIDLGSAAQWYRTAVALGQADAKRALQRIGRSASKQGGCDDLTVARRGLRPRRTR